MKQWGDHPISAIARFRWAGVLQQEGSLVEAHDLAQQGAQAFPNTPGGDLCYNLVKQIEAKSASIMTERVWNEPSPSIRVTYRNLTKVYFRLVREDWLARFKSGQYRGQWLDDAAAEGAPGREARSGLVGRPAGDRGLPAAGRGPSRAEGPEARLLLPAGQLRSGFQRVEQRRFLHGRLGEQAGPDRPAAEYRRPFRRLRARCGLRRADRRGRSAGLRLGLERPLSRPATKAKTDRNGQFSVERRRQPE